MWDDGDIYEGHKVVPYCGRCGTALSSHELGQPGAYRDVTEPSVYVRFPVVERDFDLLVWTTTPWTLVSNVAAAVGPDVEYVRVRGRDGRRDLVLAADARRRGARRRRRGGRAGRGRRPRRPALRAPVRRSLPLDDAGARVRRRRRSSPSTTAPASCTSRPRSARSTARSPTREGLPMLNPVGPAALRRSSTGAPVRRHVREGRRPRAHRRARRGRAGSNASSTTRTRTRTAGAAARRSSTGRSPRGSRAPPRTRPTLLRENETHRLAPRAHQARPLRRLAREQRRLGAVARPVLGHAAAGVALRRLRPRHVHRFGGRARRALGPRPHRPRPAPARTSTTSRSTARSASGRAHRVEPVLDAWFDSGSMPAAQFHYPFEHARRSSSSASPPTSSARRSTRRAAGSTRCSR